MAVYMYVCTQTPPTKTTNCNEWMQSIYSIVYIHIYILQNLFTNALQIHHCYHHFVKESKDDRNERKCSQQKNTQHTIQLHF